MTPITISVSEEHILHGIAKCCTDCPVALAMTDAGLKNVDVWQLALKWTDDDGLRYRADCPPVVQKFIDDFDAGRETLPFTFELRDESV